jgi:hypothetical protein
LPKLSHFVAWFGVAASLSSVGRTQPAPQPLAPPRPDAIETFVSRDFARVVAAQCTKEFAILKYLEELAYQAIRRRETPSPEDREEAAKAKAVYWRCIDHVTRTLADEVRLAFFRFERPGESLPGSLNVCAAESAIVEYANTRAGAGDMDSSAGQLRYWAAVSSEASCLAQARNQNLRDFLVARRDLVLAVLAVSPRLEMHAIAPFMSDAQKCGALRAEPDYQGDAHCLDITPKPHRMGTSWSPLLAEQRASHLAAMCDAVLPLLPVGGRYTQRWTDPSGRELDRLVISAEACGKGRR